MTCERASEIVGIGTVVSVDSQEGLEPSGPVESVVSNLLPTIRTALPQKNYSTTTSVSSSSSTYIPVTTLQSSSSNDYSLSETSTHQPISSSISLSNPSSTTDSVLSFSPVQSQSSRPARPGNVFITRSTVQPIKNQQQQSQQPQEHLTTSHQPRPPLVTGSQLHKTKTTDQSVIVKKVLKQDNSLIIHWDSESSNVHGFRVIYRVFGDPSFKFAMPLVATEREFKIKNVPYEVRKYV